MQFLSKIDTDEFLNVASNMVVCDGGTILEIEPAIAPIFDMPVGIELILKYDDNSKYFIYTDSEEICIF